MSRKKAAVILAAGQGKRMGSDLPKVLHEINGRPIIHILLDSILEIEFEKIVVVVGYKGELLVQALKDYQLKTVWQREQLGTGHAVKMAGSELADFDGDTLIALGDVPFLSANSVRKLFEQKEKDSSSAVCLSTILEDSSGYGRIVRDKNSFFLSEIVEDKDASDEIKEIKEINSGTFCFDNKLLFEMLNQLKNDNSQGEYYLTDTIKLLNDKNLKVSMVVCENPDEVRGVNSKEQLEYLEKKFH